MPNLVALELGIFNRNLNCSQRQQNELLPFWLVVGNILGGIKIQYCVKIDVVGYRFSQHSLFCDEGSWGYPLLRCRAHSSWSVAICSPIHYSSGVLAPYRQSFVELSSRCRKSTHFSGCCTAPPGESSDSQY